MEDHTDTLKFFSEPHTYILDEFIYEWTSSYLLELCLIYDSRIYIFIVTYILNINWSLLTPQISNGISYLSCDISAPTLPFRHK